MPWKQCRVVWFAQLIGGRKTVRRPDYFLFWRPTCSAIVNRSPERAQGGRPCEIPFGADHSMT